MAAGARVCTRQAVNHYNFGGFKMGVMRSEPRRKTLATFCCSDKHYQSELPDWTEFSPCILHHRHILINHEWMNWGVLKTWGMTLFCSLVVRQWKCLYLLPNGSRVNRLWLGWVLSLKWNSCQKSNQCFMCECIWVKPLCKSIITTKKGTFKIYRSFVFGQANFQWSATGTLTLTSKSLFLKTGRLEEWFTITLLPVRSHSGIDSVCLPWQLHAEDKATNMSCWKTFFLVNSVYTNNVHNVHVHV